MKHTHHNLVRQPAEIGPSGSLSELAYAGISALAPYLVAAVLILLFAPGTGLTG